MWFVLQSAIMFAVGVSNVEYHWTPNGYLVALAGGIAAYLATVLLSALISLARRAL